MSNTMLTTLSSSPFLFNSSKVKPLLSSHLHFLPSQSHLPILKLKASSSIHGPSDDNDSNRPTNPISQTLKHYAKAAILIGATASMVVLKSTHLPARAETPVTLVEQDQAQDGGAESSSSSSSSSSPLSELLESNSEAIEALKSLLRQKLESGEDDEALTILKRLVAAQPEENEWKFLMARLLAETGEIQSARQVFEEILAANPLSFEALFENALLMDRHGESEAVIGRLEEALRIAEEENKAKEARDVKLVMAQIQFLQKNVEEALRLYQELTNEDPTDFRPYFCRGMIYSLLDRNAEAREQFGKYRELSPKKFDVEGYLRSPLSKMKLFGTDEN